MECVLAGLTEENCLIYLDHIVVFSKSFEKHVEWSTNVFQALPQAGLTFKLNKCHFAQKEVTYLGQILSAAGVCPDSAKTEAVSTYIHIPKQYEGAQAVFGAG